MKRATRPVTIATAIRSVGVTPSTLPKSAASKFRVKLRVLLIRATPMAKLAVVTIPIAASAPIFLRRAVALMSSAERKPHRPAPT